MELVLRSPQIHSTFSNLGYVNSDGYHINENCNAFLETILNDIKTEDKYLRIYRRNISFGQNIEKDLIPLLLHAKDSKTIELLIKILVKLTIPVECLLSVDLISKNDFGRHIINEINNLLISTKQAFTDLRATKVLIEFLKKNLEPGLKTNLKQGKSANISNCLLLLRNILHISGESLKPNGHVVQNQILWNIFSQNIDKVLIKIMTAPDAYYWGVTMVQLIALLYKDQHVVILQKQINEWLETALSESSGDNESNTSPQARGSNDSSPMLTSAPTSDSSDTGGENQPSSSPKKRPYSEIKGEQVEKNTTDTPPISKKTSQQPEGKQNTGGKENNEISDCGYGTQIENQGSVSNAISSNDESIKKPDHQKPHNPKQRPNTKESNLQDRKKKKISKRAKSFFVNVQEGLANNTPSNDDITNVLKEFTLDFLMKGYNSLVKTLHNEIITNVKLKIDISHFFWLLTYFLKFASQIELDLQRLDSVLTYEIVSYLTAEGANLCEKFEFDVKMESSDLQPNMRRLHLIVTSIREFVQALEKYEGLAYLKKDDQEYLLRLKVKMCETTELRSLLVLLIRHYNPKYHCQQYLHDLIVTNHLLLMSLDNIMRSPDYNIPTSMVEHMRQFGTPLVMNQYGVLLEKYEDNGQFVNDCIFTIMHHVSSEPSRLETLLQPKIVKAFSSICKSDFEMCDDWNDLIEYVVNTFIRKAKARRAANSAILKLNKESVDSKMQDMSVDHELQTLDATEDSWTKEEISSLGWLYVQCDVETDMIKQLSELLAEEGICKTRKSIIKQLYKENIINKDKCKKFLVIEGLMEDILERGDDIGRLRELIVQDGNLHLLEWVQSFILETCQAKIYIEKQKLIYAEKGGEKPMTIDMFNKKASEMPTMSPVAYHSLVQGQSVPLVPWNCEQASICDDMRFLEYLRKLGFLAPADTGKEFIRIPYIWTADILYDVAGKIFPIDESKLNFSLNDLTEIKCNLVQHECIDSMDTSSDVTVIGQEHFYQVHKEKHLATMVNYTPMPGYFYYEQPDHMVPGPSQNWLNIVQQSQQLGLNYSNLESFNDDTRTDVTMTPPPHELSLSAPLDTPLLNPGGMDLDLAPATMDDPMDHLDNKSVYETASASSDKTIV